MRTIYVVYFDWAFNGSEKEGILGAYENLDDAMEGMLDYWRDEQQMDYFDELENEYISERAMERYGECYCDRHTRVEVREVYLYSHADVEKGLA
jgi:beta-N-acetylglucosaminidase